MTVFQCDGKLEWGALDVPLFGIARDWHGAAVTPAAGYALACDADDLWFIAHHRAPAMAHPRARPGAFLAGLWEHDVAEVFLADSESGRYLEFNLAPNAAWWSCEFTAPRMRADEAEIAFPDVRTWADLAPDGAWVAAMAIPLDVLRARINFGETTRANVCMCLGAPALRYLTATDLGGGAPDFHQPEKFAALDFKRLDWKNL
jgi:hypothetical protein